MQGIIQVAGDTGLKDPRSLASRKGRQTITPDKRLTTTEGGGSGCHKSRGWATFLAEVRQPVARTSGRTAFQVDEMIGAKKMAGAGIRLRGRLERPGGGQGNQSEGRQSRVGGAGEGGGGPGDCGVQDDLTFASEVEIAGWAELCSRNVDHPSKKEGMGRMTRP